jgi:type IV secretion system protein VirD4
MQKKNKSTKLILWAIIYTLITWVGNRVVFGVRTAPGNDINEKMMSSLNVIIEALTINPLPSPHMYDLLGGATIAGLVWYIRWNSKNSKKKFRSGKEHGSAIWWDKRYSLTRVS